LFADQWSVSPAADTGDIEGCVAEGVFDTFDAEGVADMIQAFAPVRTRKFWM
jgi:hypothetical protein